MIKYRNKDKSRRGFTMAEAVISLSLILIVAAVAITMVASSTSADEKARAVIEGTNFAECAVECFRFCENTGEDFTDLIDKCGYSLTGGDGAFAYVGRGIIATVTVADNTIEITVQDSSANPLVSTEYTMP